MRLVIKFLIVVAAIMVASPVSIAAWNDPMTLDCDVVMNSSFSIEPFFGTIVMKEGFPEGRSPFDTTTVMTGRADQLGFNGALLIVEKTRENQLTLIFKVGDKIKLIASQPKSKDNKVFPVLSGDVIVPPSHETNLYVPLQITVKCHI